MKMGLHKLAKFKYDKRETFVFQDGGSCFLDFKGKSFEPGIDLNNLSKDQFKERPVVLLLPGLTNTSQYVHIRNFAKAIY